MKHIQKQAMTLALLLGAATGAWAQDDIQVTQVQGQANQWQYTMPDINVELTVKYFPTAAFSEGGEPTAIDGIIAGTDNNIVSTGQSQQGTVMYYATTDVNAPAPDYDAAGWTSTVPTANVVAFGVTENVPVNVYYYIKGQDTPEGETPTAENNFNDTEIFGPLSITLLENVAHFNEGGKPTAIQGVIAGTDAALVSTGQSQQGTVMYYATTDTRPTTPDYDAEGWSATVPNAIMFGDKKENTQVYVFYYIKGNVAPEGQAATAENTFTDTEIFGPLSITMKKNLFSVAIRPLTQFNADGGQATVTVDGQPTDNYSLKQGQTITVAAAEGYKIRTAKMGDADVPVGEVTTGDLGKLVDQFGNIYADRAAAEAAGAWTIIAQIVYVGSNTGVEGYNRGLAIDTGNDLGDFYDIPGTQSLYPSQAQWNTMFEAAGGYQALNEGMTAKCGDEYDFLFLYNEGWGEPYYYSTDKDSDGNEIFFNFSTGKWEANTSVYPNYRYIRAIAPAALSGDDATLNDAKTVATYTVPDHDATVKYLLARDLTHQVAFAGIPAEPVSVTMGPDGNYQPATPLDIQLNDAIAGADIISADGLTVSYERQGDGDTWTAADDFLTNMQPGTYRVVAAATDEMSPYYGTLTSATTFTLVESGIRLDETADNSPVLAKKNGQEANVTLTRTLQAGGYNTFAVPFSMDKPEGWTVKELSSASFADGVLTLNFTDAASIVAGKPYLVKVGANTNLSASAFTDVIISKDAVSFTSTNVDFIPTLGATTIGSEGDDAKTVLFLGAGNKLYNPEALPAQMKGFRAYFLLKGDAAAEARAFRMDFGDGETTFISEALKVKSEEFATATGWYTLDGRRIEGQPTQRSAEGRLFPQGLKKGVYIVNGKKKVIK